MTIMIYLTMRCHYQPISGLGGHARFGGSENDRLELGSGPERADRNVAKDVLCQPPVG